MWYPSAKCFPAMLANMQRQIALDGGIVNLFANI